MMVLTPRRRLRDERAAVAVEFALVFPVLALLVFGIIQYGLYFFSMQAGSSAAREAARRAAVGDFAECDDFRDYVEDRIGSASFGGAVTVERTYAKGPDNTASGVQVGDVVSVRVQFNGFNLHVPLIPVVGDATVNTTADSRVEYVPTTPEVCS